MKYANDLENEEIEKSTILEFEGNFSEKQKRTEVHNFFKKYLKRYDSDTFTPTPKEGEDNSQLRMIRIFLKEGIGKNKR